MSSQVSTISSAPRQGLNARQAETVERLLAAGAAQLQAVGHEALTIRTVAHRAGVSPATAYTYLASKNHLFAELFWRLLVEHRGPAPRGRTPAARMRSVMRELANLLAGSPALTAAVTPALLGSDADVERLRIRIGAEFLDRFRTALGEDADPRLLDVLGLSFFGALLQVGTGFLSYDDLVARMDDAVDVIMEGH